MDSVHLGESPRDPSPLNDTKGIQGPNMVAKLALSQGVEGLSAKRGMTMMRSCFSGANFALSRPTAVLSGPETFSKKCSPCGVENASNREMEMEM
jgi:hypothetical protein